MVIRRLTALGGVLVLAGCAIGRAAPPPTDAIAAADLGIQRAEQADACGATSWQPVPSRLW